MVLAQAPGVVAELRKAMLRPKMETRLLYGRSGVKQEERWKLGQQLLKSVMIAMRVDTLAIMPPMPCCLSNITRVTAGACAAEGSSHRSPAAASRSTLKVMRVWQVSGRKLMTKSSQKAGCGAEGVLMPSHLVSLQSQRKLLMKLLGPVSQLLA